MDVESREPNAGARSRFERLGSRVGKESASAKKIDPSSLTELHLVADAERSC